VPQMPLGSAAETAMAVTIGLSKTLVHSSDVKFRLLAIGILSWPSMKERSVVAREIRTMASSACLTVFCSQSMKRQWLS
jgi:hypothetical protein